MSWNVEFYEESNGSSPVKEFLDALSDKERSRVFQRIQLLEDQGPHLGFPFSSQIEGRLRELRLQFGKADYRILYYGDAQRSFVLLHIFRKQTAQTPRKDVEIGLKRMHQDIQSKYKEGDYS